MKHKEQFYKIIFKDISEAHELFYKSMKSYLILALILKENTNTKDTSHVNKTKTEVYRYLSKKKDGVPTGASPSLDA